ncbi:TetR/AcrR family transcriptional regulator [Mariniluteicoccus endophyticus]
MSQGSRQAIFHATWAVIARGGLTAVTMRAVAQAAGVSLGRVQHYFPTKDALVLEACAAMLAGAESVYAAEDDEPAARLRFAVGHVLPSDERSLAGTRVWYAYAAHAQVDPRIGTLLANAKRGQEDEATRLLEELGTKNARAVARALVGLADGLAQRVLIGDLTAAEAGATLDEALSSS